MIWDEFLRHFRFCDEEDSGLSDEENFLEKFKTASYPMDRKIQHYDLEINYSLKPHSSYVAKIWNYVTKTYKHQKKNGTVVENFKC